MLTAMAREVVTQKGVVEKADELWRQIQKQQMHVIESSRPAVVESTIAVSRGIADIAYGTAAIRGDATFAERIGRLDR
jgi:hypothetical protein